MAARITLVLGDITEQHVDAVVNAANSSLLGGGGAVLDVFRIVWHSPTHRVTEPDVPGWGPPSNLPV